MICLSVTLSSHALALLWSSRVHCTDGLTCWLNRLLRCFPPLTEDQYICDFIDLIMVLFL